MSGGAAMIMVGILLTTTGILSIFLYNKQANALDDIFSGKDLLAKWELSAKEWEDFFPKAEKAKQGQKLILWGIMTFFFILFAGIFFFFIEDREDAQLFLLTMASCWIFISLLVYIIQKSSKISSKNREIYIGKKGVYVNGQAHLWKGVGTNLMHVEHLKTDQLLKFTYSSPATYSPQVIEVLVPIASRHKSLDKVIAYFGQGQNKQEDELPSDHNYFETEL